MPVNPTSSLDAFAHLLGRWELTREIPGHATARGHATVDLLAPGSAHYQEHVTLHLPGDVSLPGTAAYLLRRRDAISLDVLFPHTGELFEQLHFLPDSDAALTAEASHVCAPDLYRSLWRILPCGTVTVTHHVRGPRKNYTAHTRLTRAPAPYAQRGNERSPSSSTSGDR